MVRHSLHMNLSRNENVPDHVLREAEFKTLIKILHDSVWNTISSLILSTLDDASPPVKEWIMENLPLERFVYGEAWTADFRAGLQ